MAEELVPTNIDTSKDNDIASLANRCQNDEIISSALSEHTVDNMKAFLLVYSRSQLNRIIKLTNSIETLEDRLLNQAINTENADPYYLMDVIRLIQKSLDSSIALIKQVTSDDSYLKIIINNTEIIQNNINQTNNTIPILANQDSRDKVRAAVSAILSKVSDLDSKGLGGSDDVIVP